jgi:hypothetical protein
LLPRYRCPVSEALRVFLVRPRVDLPSTQPHQLPGFHINPGDARGVGSSTASSNETPDDASGSLLPAAQYGRHLSIWAKSGVVRPKTDGRNRSIAAGKNGISASLAAVAVPDFQVPAHAGCECSIEAFRGLH